MMLPEVDISADECGDLYDECSLWSARFGLPLLDRAVLRPGMTVLDVGAGTGFMTIELAQRCGTGTTVIAVDPWQSAMKRLARKVAYLGLQNVVMRTESIEAIDLPDESVDMIVSNLGVNNFADPQAALRTCGRLAKPGAALLLTANLVGHMAEFYDVFRGVLKELGFSQHLAALEAHIQHRATVDTLTSMLESAGFELVEVATSSFRERFADGTSLLRHYFVRLGFMPGWRSVVPPEIAPTIFAAIEERLNALALRGGPLELTIPAACIQAGKPRTR